MALSTACREASLTRAVPLRMRETVLGETPAALATMSKVTVPGVSVAGADLARNRGSWAFVMGVVDARNGP